MLTYNTNPARRIYERFTYQPAEFYDGTRHTVSGAVGVRATSHLATELQFNRNDVEAAVRRLRREPRRFSASTTPSRRVHVCGA